MTLRKHPTVGARVLDTKRNVRGTVEYSGFDGYSVQWDGGFRVTGYNEKNWKEHTLCGADYPMAAQAVGELVAAKQVAYGDSFNRSQQILKTLYPQGIQPSQYHQMLTMVRIIDKMFRIANQPDAFGESPYQDIVGYALLGMHSTDGDK